MQFGLLCPRSEVESSQTISIVRINSSYHNSRLYFIYFFRFFFSFRGPAERMNAAGRLGKRSRLGSAWRGTKRLRRRRRPSGRGEGGAPSRGSCVQYDISGDPMVSLSGALSFSPFLFSSQLFVRTCCFSFPPPPSLSLDRSIEIYPPPCPHLFSTLTCPALIYTFDAHQIRIQQYCSVFLGRAAPSHVFFFFLKPARSIYRSPCGRQAGSRTAEPIARNAQAVGGATEAAERAAQTQ